MSCRVALLRMHRDGLITLPPPQKRNGNGHRRPAITSASDPALPVTGTPAGLPGLQLRRVNDRAESRLWNELVERYHYLGYQPLPGAQVRYFIDDGVRPLGAIGISAAAWKAAPRDDFIGWTPAQRERRLHLVVDNSRFLILPWVQVRNLASAVLATMARQARVDWLATYGYEPVLIETFVERARFKGTCYRAANWICVGQTQGRGKLDRYKLRALPVKDIFLYPLRKDFRTVLADSRL